MKKLLRLFVMMSIRHDENYVKGSMKSAGIPVEDLTHREIALYKATLKQIEADLMIEMAYKSDKTSMEDFDYSKLINNPTP